MSSCIWEQCLDCRTTARHVYFFKGDDVQKCATITEVWALWQWSAVFWDVFTCYSLHLYCRMSVDTVDHLCDGGQGEY